MSPRAKDPKKAVLKPSQIRVIGGKWRSRKLSFPPIQGLRPTPDRVRETVFNWLQNTLVGADCLDLFAGSGALGIEALSRGANNCTFIDLAAKSCQSLRQNLTLLECKDAEVIQADAIAWIKQNTHNKLGITKAFDIIFLDPPFNQNLCQSACQTLIDKNLVGVNSYVYIETELQLKLSLNWTLYREKTSGQVRYRLYKVANK
jgi:16S rRNA (guanine966-N2)-methyltransferase